MISNRNILIMSKDKNPYLSTKIKGIFYKTEITNDKTFYHFILPNIFHNDQSQSHTINVLKEFDKKTIKYFHGTDELKLDQIIVDNNICSAKIFKPIYRENGLIKIHNTSHPIDYTTLKARSREKLELIVGLEYLLDVDCISNNFTNNDTHENITYWTIYINHYKEITKLEH